MTLQNLAASPGEISSDPDWWMPRHGMAVLRPELLFGTYYLPYNAHPGPYGIDTHMPTSYLGQLLQPLWRTRASTRKQLETDNLR